ncbi:unnamed protein product, partial [Mesorhabditis belari]|uniref:Aquaporin n=1 Tax=Mesorhabditis belari TaxID=2138241 RepID=A0AAF3F993_9BILA
MLVMSDHQLPTDLWESHGRPALAELFASSVYSFLVLLSSTPTSLSTFVIFDGIALSVSMFSVLRISGAHLNPAISLAYTICGKMSVISLVSYTISQFFGAFFGTALGCWVMTADRYEDTFIGNSLTAEDYNPQINRFKALCLESLLNSLLILSHLLASDSTKEMIPLIVGLVRVCSFSSGVSLLGLFGSPSLSLASSTIRSILLSSLSPLAFFYLMLLAAIGSSLLSSCLLFVLSIIDSSSKFP